MVRCIHLIKETFIKFGIHSFNAKILLRGGSEDSTIMITGCNPLVAPEKENMSRMNDFVTVLLSIFTHNMAPDTNMDLTLAKTNDGHILINFE